MRVKRGHAVYLRQGNIQPLRHHDLDLLRQVSEDLLRGLEDRHGRSGCPLCDAEDLPQPFLLLGRAPIGDHGFAVWHESVPSLLK